MSAAVYLRNFIRQQVSQHAHQLTPEHLQVLIDIVYRGLVAEEVTVPLKRHLFLTFEHLISLYQSQEEEKERTF